MRAQRHKKTIIARELAYQANWRWRIFTKPRTELLRKLAKQERQRKRGYTFPPLIFRRHLPYGAM